MRGLLIEAASQLGKIVLLEVEDPAPEKRYYDCEVEFESIVKAVQGYFLEKHGIELKRFDRDGVMVLGLTDAERATLVEKKPKVDSSNKSKRSLWNRWFSRDKSDESIQEEKHQIKQLNLDKEKEVGNETKAVKSLKPVGPPRKLKADEFELIQLKPMVKTSTLKQKNTKSEELPNLEVLPNLKLDSDSEKIKLEKASPKSKRKGNQFPDL